MDSVADIVLLLVERAFMLSNPYAIGQLLVAFVDENVPELLSKSSLNGGHSTHWMFHFRRGSMKYHKPRFFCKRTLVVYICKQRSELFDMFRDIARVKQWENSHQKLGFVW
jgi:hypothetical protein